MAESFERDFGYLMPFLEKVAAAAGELQGPAREEALALVTGERERWTRLRELLAGAEGQASAKAEASPPKAASPAQGLTVGSLRPTR